MSTFFLEAFSVKSIRFGSERRRRFVLALTLRTDARRSAERLVVACAIPMAIGLLGNPARAQDTPSSRQVEFGLMAGGAGVTGQFRGKVSSGPAVGAELQLPLSPRWLGLRTDLLYQSIADYHHACLSGNSYDCAYSTNVSQILSGSLGVVARLNDADARWSPYVVAGVATYNVGTSNSPLVATMHTNHFGWQGGLGIEMRSPKRVLFAEIRYMTIAPGGVVPIVVGMRF